MVSELICIIYVIVSLCIEIRCVYKEGRVYFKSFWNIFHAIAILLFLVATGFYITRSIYTVKLLEEVMNNKGKEIEFFLMSLNDRLCY